jgi:type IV pilus biogenesis protein CpaD/CtpE
MNSYKTLTALIGLPVVATLTACAPTLTEQNFGVSVRQMIESQTNDPSTLTTPSTDTIEDSDGRRLEAVLDTYRNDVAKPEAISEDIVFSVDGAR